MKKTISLLLSLLLITTVFTALPLTASAATADSAAGDRPLPELPHGDFGSCSWLFNPANGKLTVSGTGATGDFNNAAKPWADYTDDITEVVIMNGITSLGRQLFAETPHLQTVSMAPSVTAINREAFLRCTELTSVTLTESVTGIGIGAFMSTGLTSITIPNPSCTLDAFAVGYYEGRNFQMFPKANFTVYGYGASTAQSYAGQNNFVYIDLNAAAHEVYVSHGTAYSVNTGEAVTEARAGERLRVEADKMERFTVFESFSADNVTLDETDWSFTMPDESVYISMDYYQANPLNLDLSGGFCSISESTYLYLVDLIQTGQLNGSLKQNSTGNHDEYDISFADGAEVLLSYDHISVFDDEYAPSYSEALSVNHPYNPVNFIFADNEIYQGHVDVTLPAVGSSWDYYTMQANVVPTNDTWNTGRFTVSEPVWYNRYGISLFDTFEGGETYFVGFSLIPNNGYYFTLNTKVVLHVVGTERTIYLDPLYMNADGSIYYSNGLPSQQIRLIGGEPHSINISSGYATLSESETHVTQAVPGQLVYVHADWTELDDDEYIVMGSVACTSDDVDITDSEMVDVWYFYMPNHDVTGILTYNTGVQTNTVLPLYSGEVTVPGNASQTSERFGTSVVLSRKCADSEHDYDAGITKYDIDGDGSWDIQCSQGNVYSLLPTNSLTQNVTLTLTREESAHYPVRSVRLQVVAETAHSITVIGGVASSERSDFANEHVITQAYPGETVYVVPRSSDIGDDSYVVQFSMSATSDDVTIIDDAIICFTMPNKDVTVRYDYDCYTQDISIFDFRHSNTCAVSRTEPGVQSEAYGASMVLRLTAADWQIVSDTVHRYDIDGDGSWDIEQDTDTDTYTLLSTHSLPETDVNLTLTREQSWTLPVRTVLIMTHDTAPTSLRGDVDRDGVVTINDATLLQRFLAEFTNPDGTPLLDLDDPDTFHRADANNDGYISIKDVTAIQRYLAGLGDLMP